MSAGLDLSSLKNAIARLDEAIDPRRLPAADGPSVRVRVARDGPGAAHVRPRSRDRSRRSLTRRESLDLAEGFDESDIPYRVDIVDLHAASDGFKAIVERDKVALPRDP
jgi:hypothetical protein